MDLGRLVGICNLWATAGAAGHERNRRGSINVRIPIRQDARRGEKMRMIKASEPAARLIPRVVSWRSGHDTALTVSGYGVRFFVDRGRLVIEDGFASEGTRRRTILSRGTCTLQRIVVVGRTGLITLDALQWLADLGIAILFVGVGGHLTSVFTPGGPEGSKTRLHRIQATARTSEAGVRVAQLLIG